MEIRIVKSSTEKLSTVDAVVNSTNSRIKGLLGVDHAIQNAAGWEQNKDCAKNGGCVVGIPVTTVGEYFSDKIVIHIVAPDRNVTDAETLMKKCYAGVIKEAVYQDVSSIAIPVIGVRDHGWSAEESIKIAIDAALEMDHQECHNLSRIIFAIPDEKIYSIALMYLRTKSDTVLNDIEVTLFLQDIDNAKLTKFIEKTWLNNSEFKIIESFLNLKFMSGLAKFSELSCINSRIRNAIENGLRKEEIYCRLHKFHIKVDGDKLECGIRLDALDFSEVINAVNEKMKNGKSVYENELLPFLLVAVDEGITDSEKYKLLERIINNLPERVLDKIASDICNRFGLGFGISGIECKII